MALLTGEAGANPARDRRRKAQTIFALIRMPRSEDMPLGFFLRRLSVDASKSEYSVSKAPTHAADAPALGKYKFKENTRMKCNSLKKWLALIGCIVLIAALALTTTGCGSKEEAQEPVGENNAPVEIVGEGATVFQFSVVDLDGNESKFEVHTDETTVGAALLKEGLIEGEEGPYGLYVMKVNGIEAIYEEDGSYWAFYENGEYGMTGVDLTDIDPSVAYSFVQTKD